MKNLLINLLKGAAMGAADAVPGVSGGTIALILGVYERLIKALSGFNLTVIQHLLRGDIVSAWKAMDATFLLQLFTGLVLSLVGLLQVVRWLMLNQPILLWAFFLGLVATSVWYLARQFRWSPQAYGLFALGMAATAALAFLTPAQIELTPTTAFIGGAIAICAMILPGISGSFMLILMGLYLPVSEALHDREVLLMLCFVAGCAAGLLSFSKLLRWFLDRYHVATLALMTGIVAGATVKLWPWQNWQALQAAADSKTYVASQWLWPTDYSVLTGSSSQLVAAVVLFLLGSALIVILDRVGQPA